MNQEKKLKSNSHNFNGSVSNVPSAVLGGLKF